MQNQDQVGLVDRVLEKLFGKDEPALAPAAIEIPQLQMRVEPVKTNKTPRTFATYSQLMTLAHYINRKNGRLHTKGCWCYSCEVARDREHSRRKAH